jgi:hypothetical protein
MLHLTPLSMPPRVVLRLAVAGLLVGACGGSSGAAPSSGSGCMQQMNGGLNVQQCTCEAMTAMPPSQNPNSKVLIVDSTTSDQIDPDYDLGLPAGTPVCFVSMAGQVTVPSPPAVDADASAPTYNYSFVIYTESPWSVAESGANSMPLTPASDK